MANTTWNPSDKAANVTLSGDNLTATTAAGTGSGVRTVDKQSAGKFYWEFTATAVGTAASGVGVVSPTLDLTIASNGFSVAKPVGSSCGAIRTGLILVDGVSTGISLGTITGLVVCIAFDVSARLIWFRLGAGGNWNNSASANPATGVGGIATTIGIGIPVYPAALLVSSTDAITANFGDTAFTGAVPSGFTSGFTAGASAGNNALVTQVALEMWASVAITAAPTGRAKVWNGSAWVLKPVKVWSGSAWVEKPAKVWNGSAWV
jgi:hypothetical protein